MSCWNTTYSVWLTNSFHAWCGSTKSTFSQMTAFECGQKNRGKNKDSLKLMSCSFVFVLFILFSVISTLINYFFCIYLTMNKWLFTLKAETLKALFQHSDPSLSHFFQTKKNKKIHSVIPHLETDRCNAGCFSMCIASLLCMPLLLSHVMPSGSPTSPLFTSPTFPHNTLSSQFKVT